MTELKRFTQADATASALQDVMQAEHAVIVENVLAPGQVEAILSELEPFIDGTQPIDEQTTEDETHRQDGRLTEREHDPLR